MSSNAKFYEYNGTKVMFAIDHYFDNGNLALVMMTELGSMYGTLTVNIGRLCAPDCSYIDTNNLPGAMEFIEENKLGTPTGVYGRSGFCTYPEVRFSNAFLDSCQRP